MKKIFIILIGLFIVFSFRIEALGSNFSTISESGQFNTMVKYLDKFNNDNNLLLNEYTVYKKVTTTENGDFINNLVSLKPMTKENFEIIESRSLGIYRYLADSTSLTEAIKIADEINNSDILDGNSITAVLSKNGQIVYSPMAIGRMIKHKNGVPYLKYNLNSDIYEDENLQKPYTYINQQYIDDVAVIEDKGDRAKIQISGYEGWVNKDITKDDYDMVVMPINQVKNLSYYEKINGELTHFISSDILSDKFKGNKLKIGEGPKHLEEGKKYYSYDGEYFYASIDELITDLKVGKKDRAINKNEKFSSKYLNLSFQSKSNLTALEINKFLRENTSVNSKLRGIGEALIEAQNNYGVNAITILAIAVNESGWGNSQIARLKNNLFGINAVDFSPGVSAGSFASVDDCINEFAKNYIAEGYGNPNSWRYNGSFLGNKKSGAAVKYASDPYWGEKAVSVICEILM